MNYNTVLLEISINLNNIESDFSMGIIIGGVILLIMLISSMSNNSDHKRQERLRHKHDKCCDALECLVLNSHELDRDYLLYKKLKAIHQVIDKELISMTKYEFDYYQKEVKYLMDEFERISGMKFDNFNKESDHSIIFRRNTQFYNRLTTLHKEIVSKAIDYQQYVVDEMQQ